jgi:hypothetical protein
MVGFFSELLMAWPRLGQVEAAAIVQLRDGRWVLICSTKWAC